MANQPLVNVTLLFLCFIPEMALAVSFDCKKANLEIEKIICINPDLSKQDDNLNVLYKKALQNEKAASSVRQAQKNWMKERNDCREISCISHVYEKRIAELQTSFSSPSTSDAYVLVKQDLDETTDNLFHIEPDPRVCSLYLENLNLFAHKNAPLSCGRPIADKLKGRIKEVEWEDLNPEKYLPLFQQMILVESLGRAKGIDFWRTYEQQVKVKEYVFRRAKVELQGKTFREFNESYGLPYSSKGQPDTLNGRFFIVQFGRNDKDIAAPVQPCKPIRGGGTTSARFYLVNDKMDEAINYLRVTVKGDFGRDKLLLIDDKLYAEDIFGDGAIHLLRVAQKDRIELEMLCSYRFKPSVSSVEK